METYRKIVEQLAREKIYAEIPNGDIDHASELVSAIFRFGKEEINIFTGDLEESFYSDPKIFQWFTAYTLIGNGNVNIIVQNLTENELKNHEIFKFILDNNLSENCKFFIANGDEVKKDENHFITMDSRGYRLETNHEKKQARANFNDPKQVSELKARFNIYKNQSSPVAA